MSLVLHLTDNHSTQSISSKDDFLFRLLFVEKGEGCYQAGQRTIRAVPGDLILVLPGEIYDLSGLENTGRWVVTFNADTLTPAQLDVEEFVTLFSGLPFLLYSDSNRDESIIYHKHFQVDSIDWQRRLMWLQQLEWELHNQPLGYAETVHSLLKLLFFDVVRLVEPYLKRNLSLCNPLLTQVFHFIEANHCNSIGLHDVAKAVGRSPAYLTDLVRRETGKTVLCWIVEYRMVNARRLLLYTNQSISQIAESVGYFDRRHFGRQFLRLHNATPQAWRDANRTNNSHSIAVRKVANKDSKNFSQVNSPSTSKQKIPALSY